MDSIVLSKKEFNDLRNLVYSTSGINLHEGKLELLKSKIAKRMRLTKKSLKDYLRYLNTDEKEVIEFIDTVTTNHSFFFRENKSIEYIINQFNNHPQKDKKEFKIWCAACSTGDEPYSVAVQLKNLGLSFSIMATDISHTVLDTAARGIYKTEKLKKVPLPILHRFFQKGTGKYTGYIKVKKDITRHIMFKKFNLIKDPAPQMNFDAVLCRNVMIYFDAQTSEKVINKLYQTIVPKGFFAIGNAESLMNLTHNYKSIKKIPSLYIK
ncbi:CheR family methyltransferase [Desulfobacula toluolica]|uniref:protein-glutamate O-methyltransferase n=1 Tax=Desulfobacula toluolica (strain DSM 7467 / Tol2) TaxID=651182 RepID=K0NP91_DESTT|nr:protein-glutamate O-methyltransferase CheR [Desulfobacula toluolica]CCK80612.1 CheR2: chemotaxis protein methyltransferase [Desulfobacula toluolica Tol2]